MNGCDESTSFESELDIISSAHLVLGISILITTLFALVTSLLNYPHLVTSVERNPISHFIKGISIDSLFSCFLEREKYAYLVVLRRRAETELETSHFV